ncbi:hypothetical protein DPMN_023449 [Dreissena polymorpha]|uniref:Uncharacterized protein n=1 Tax=Dreissena polymorpha TaxID=45954 RepID=A0A9D4RAQ7_DREPO|nr:hypothetical protein DPMN_023449 [Dreissena polymorpha]
MASTRAILVCIVMATIVLVAEARMCHMHPATMSCMDVVPRGGPFKGVPRCSRTGKQCQLKIRRQSDQWCMCRAERDGHQQY